MKESSAPRRKGRGVVVEVEMDLPFLRRNIPKTKKRSNNSRRENEPRHAAAVKEDKQFGNHQPLPDPSSSEQPARNSRSGVALPFLPRSTRPRIRRQAVAALETKEPPDPVIRHSKISAPSRAAAVARWWCSHVERRATTTAAGEHDDPPRIMTTTRHPLLTEEADDQHCSGYPCPICHDHFRPYAASSSSVRMMTIAAAAAAVGRQELWLHCLSIHGHQFHFQALQTQDGVFHLIAQQRQEDTIIDDSNSSRCRRPRRMRPGTTTTEIVYWRHAAGAVETNVVHEFPLLEERWRTGVSLPIRPYYRDAVTFDPMRIAEWLLLDQQPDQEVDDDDDWRALHDDSKLCELTDVSPKEKHFFLLWNHFMQANPILSQIQLPAQMLAFVREYGATLAEHGLEEQWMAHLTNLWYEGVLGRDRVVECMDLYNNASATLEGALPPPPGDDDATLPGRVAACDNLLAPPGAPS